ncbi:28S ribosomal protein S10 [Blattella germanica]|nr:28S ribosomal protein S10 [Blattella germanica]
MNACWTPRKANLERLTLLKSVHIYKKHRVQYEFRTYFRFMQFLRLTGSTTDTFLEYIQRNLPEGCAMKVTRVQLTPLPQHLTTRP